MSEAYEGRVWAIEDGSFIGGGVFSGESQVVGLIHSQQFRRWVARGCGIYQANEAGDWRFDADTEAVLIKRHDAAGLRTDNGGNGYESKGFYNNQQFQLF